MKVLIAGDYCPQERVATYFEKEDYSVLKSIRPSIEQSDYSIVNLECPIVDDKCFPIEKVGPHLKCSEFGVMALKYAGFKCVSLANNHFKDYGELGIKQTLKQLNKEGIEYLGGGLDLKDASRVLYKEINGEKLAIINICEHEFSVATNNSPGANPLNPIENYYDILEARKQSNYVIVIVHGGHEMYPLPSLRMKEIYHFFIDVGADAVLNHHQHCYSGFEIYKGKPIFYGLGNFMFDRSSRRNCIWNKGYMVCLQFGGEDIKYEIIPYIQCDTEPTVRIMNNQERVEFDNKIKELNEIISDDRLLNQKHEFWMGKNSRNFLSIFQPYNTRFLNSLYIRGYLPSFINPKKRVRILNYLNCESHLEKLRFLIGMK